ncbi:protein of unknown function [Hyphomicrobium sp. MC1]|nr:protein of unknown function [Hyphomicrobium sp. MC1]
MYRSLSTWRRPRGGWKTCMRAAVGVASDAPTPKRLLGMFRLDIIFLRVFHCHQTDILESELGIIFNTLVKIKHFCSNAGAGPTGSIDSHESAYRFPLRHRRQSRGAYRLPWCAIGAR